MLTAPTTNGSNKRRRASLADRSNTPQSNAVEVSERPSKRVKEEKPSLWAQGVEFLARKLKLKKTSPARPLEQQLRESKTKHRRYHAAKAAMTSTPVPTKARLAPSQVFSSPITPIQSTPKSAVQTPAAEPEPSPYQLAVTQWKWDEAVARAAGREPPPKPARPPKTPKSSKRGSKRMGGASVGGAAAQTTPATPGEKRRPMLQTEHDLDVKRRREARKVDTLRELQDAGTQCSSREKEEQQLSLAEYSAHVQSRLALASPQPNVKITRSGSSRSFIPVAQRATTFVDDKIAIAKRTLSSPVTKLPTFEFDKVRQALDEAEQKAQLELEGEVRRGRIFPESLKRAQQEIVDANFANKSFNSTIPGGEVAHKDLIRLRGLQWLNDEVITFYAQMLNARSAAAHPKDGPKPAVEKGVEAGMTIKDSHTYNSFFYKLYDEGGFVKVQRWSRKFDTFAKSIIIIPINLGNAHWVCGAINIEKKRFEYYDSLGGPNKRVYAKLRKYLEEEHMHKKKKPIDLSEWQNYWNDDVPQQGNSCDCGIFTCQFMESLSREVDGFDFTQSQMPYFRNKMALEMQEKRLIPEETWDRI